MALEGAEVAVVLRNSVWIYPLVNAGHILGVALLVGSIAPLDLRLLGLWRAVPLAPLWNVLTRTAGAGFVLAMVFGSLLFITRATEYIASDLFLCKMAVVGLGAVNALFLRALPVGEARSPTRGKLPRLRFAGGVSLVVWLVALTLGRLVGYF